MADTIKQRWEALGAAGKAGLAGGVIVVAVLFIIGAAWVLRDDYQVLFSELEPQDGAAIVAELERMKVPYRLADNGTTVLVDRDLVHKSRLKLMGKGIALKGTVGFEIFNNSEFGMTEFAQKINYQRALQGELARTIMSLDEVKYARVHLVVPESGLLKRGAVKPKASVTLTLRADRRLRPEQVLGVQRLVAAAVAEMEPASVIVLDQQGVALGRPGDDEETGRVSARFELKKSAEIYFTKKVVEVLDKTFGPGQAIVSVDVTLDQDQVKITREDVIPFTRRSGEVAGSVTRRRQQFQGRLVAGNDADPLSPAVVQNASRGGPQSSTIEVEYENGKKVEQIVSAPGSLRRLSVGVILPGHIEAARIERVSEVISMTVGLNRQRGDAIAVHSLDQFVSGAPGKRSGDTGISLDAASIPAQAPTPHSGGDQTVAAVEGSVWLLGAACVLALALLVILALGRRRPQAPSMTEEQRQEMLAQIKNWVESGRMPAQGRA